MTKGPGPSEDIPAPSTIIPTSGSSLTCSKTCVTFSPSLITSSGIMPSSFSIILAKESGISYIKAAAKLIDEGAIKGKGASGLGTYLEFIANAFEMLQTHNLSELVEHINVKSGLYDFHKKEPGEKGKTRTENLDELVSAGSFL